MVNVNGTAAVIAAKGNSPLSSLPAAAASINDQPRTSIILYAVDYYSIRVFWKFARVYTHVPTKLGSVQITRNSLVLSGEASSNADLTVVVMKSKIWHTYGKYSSMYSDKTYCGRYPLRTAKGRRVKIFISFLDNTVVLN